MTAHDNESAAEPMTPESAAADEAPEPISAEPSNVHAQAFTGVHVSTIPLSQPPPLMHTPTMDSTDGSVGQRCALASRAARQGSLARLTEWFPGYDFDAAAHTTDDRRFSVLDIGSALHDHLGALETVERIVANHDLTGRQVRFLHGEKPGEPAKVYESYRPEVRRLRVGPMVEALEQQHTANLNNIDAFDPVLGGVIEDLERVYGCPINTNVYISSGEAVGFGAHWDAHDTIIVPAVGAKKWTIFEPSILSPLRPWAGDEVSPRPVWEGVIEPGMCLVIPRGWGHEVGESDGLAIHYTIGVMRLTAQNLIQRMILDGGFNHLLRADLAYSSEQEAISYEGSVHEEGAFAEAIAEVANEELISRVISSFRSQLPLRQFPRLFDTWSAAATNDWRGAVLRIPVPAGIQVVAVVPQRAVLAFGNMRIDVSPDAFEVLITLADAMPHRFEDLPTSEASPEIKADVCRELVLAGIADVTFPAP